MGPQIGKLGLFRAKKTLKTKGKWPSPKMAQFTDAFWAPVSPVWASSRPKTLKNGKKWPDVGSSEGPSKCFWAQFTPEDAEGDWDLLNTEMKHKSL